jgi:hypothetical protein
MWILFTKLLFVNFAGVDVQTCDLVIRFDKIDTFQSYVQSKGRARAKESLVYEFIMENNFCTYKEYFDL